LGWGCLRRSEHLFFVGRDWSNASHTHLSRFFADTCLCKSVVAFATEADRHNEGVNEDTVTTRWESSQPHHSVEGGRQPPCVSAPASTNDLSRSSFVRSRCLCMCVRECVCVWPEVCVGVSCVDVWSVRHMSGKWRRARGSTEDGVWLVTFTFVCGRMVFQICRKRASGASLVFWRRQRTAHAHWVCCPSSPSCAYWWTGDHPRRTFTNLDTC
jgi:hypothetical protein